MQCSIIITPARTARIGLPLSLIHALDSLPGAAGAVRADFVFKMTLLLGAAGVVVEVSWLKQPTHEVHPPPPPLLPFLTLFPLRCGQLRLSSSRALQLGVARVPLPPNLSCSSTHTISHVPPSHTPAALQGAPCVSLARDVLECWGLNASQKVQPALCQSGQRSSV